MAGYWAGDHELAFTLQMYSQARDVSTFIKAVTGYFCVPDRVQFGQKFHRVLNRVHRVQSAHDWVQFPQIGRGNTAQPEIYIVNWKKVKIVLIPLGSLAETQKFRIFSVGSSLPEIGTGSMGLERLLNS